MDSIGLIIRIIGKGGLIGECAKLYINDAEKRKWFIMECSEQCHNKSMRNYLGEQLTNDILKYISVHKKGQLSCKK